MRDVMFSAYYCVGKNELFKWNEACSCQGENHQGSDLQSVFGLSKISSNYSNSMLVSHIHFSCIRPDMGQYIQLCLLDGSLCENCE